MSDTRDKNSPDVADLDAALQVLAALDAKPITDQVEILTAIHHQLTTNLSDLDHL